MTNMFINRRATGFLLSVIVVSTTLVSTAADQSSLALEIPPTPLFQDEAYGSPFLRTYPELDARLVRAITNALTGLKGEGISDGDAVHGEYRLAPLSVATPVAFDFVHVLFNTAETQIGVELKGVGFDTSESSYTQVSPLLWGFIALSPCSWSARGTVVAADVNFNIDIKHSLRHGQRTTRLVEHGATVAQSTIKVDQQGGWVCPLHEHDPNITRAVEQRLRRFIESTIPSTIASAIREVLRDRIW